MPKASRYSAVATTGAAQGVGFPVLAAPEGGLLPGQVTDLDPSVDVCSPAQSAIAPRADMPGPWFVTNLGTNTLYYGASGVTSATGTAVTSGSKSAAIPSLNFTTFVVCAPGQVTIFRVSNS